MPSDCKLSRKIIHNNIEIVMWLVVEKCLNVDVVMFAGS